MQPSLASCPRGRLRRVKSLSGRGAATHTERHAAPTDRSRFHGRTGAAGRACAIIPGCEAGGDFRAPRSRLELDRYYWFCLDHVRAYNLAWNYYAGMSGSEIEAEIRRDTVWQRPSWRLGERHGPGPSDQRPVQLYPGQPLWFRSPRQSQSRRPRTGEAHARAVSARNRHSRFSSSNRPLPRCGSRRGIKSSSSSTTRTRMAATRTPRKRLQLINQAYATLKASYFD